MKRIRSLSIPPAWEKVWICPPANGHLQATGIDAKGRKQYRYHPTWRTVRDEAKFERLLSFAEVLPKISQVYRNLSPATLIVLYFYSKAHSMRNDTSTRQTDGEAVSGQEMKNVDSNRLSNLPTYNDEGCVHAVVEAPKGSLVKLKYDIKLGVFTVSRGLPLGMSYPFDWGFVPSTRAPDGDPLDVLVVHEASTYPGALLPCRPLGVVEMDQDDKDGKRERNDRVIVIPSWHDRLGELERASELPSALREEIEHFFLSTTWAVRASLQTIPANRA